MRFLPFKTEAIRILLTNNNVSCSPIRFDSCTDCVIAQVWGGVKRSDGIVLYYNVLLCNWLKKCNTISIGKSNSMG